MESFEVCRCVPHCHPSDRSLLRDAQVSLLVVCDGGPQSITEIDDREILQPALRVLEPQATARTGSRRPGRAEASTVLRCRSGGRSAVNPFVFDAGPASSA